MTHAIIRGKNGRRHEVDFGDDPVRVEVYASEDLDNAPYRIPLYAMVNLINTLILGIELPSTVVTAINRKIEQYYISEEYKYRVAREIRE
jgi:hypothetical protein